MLMDELEKQAGAEPQQSVQEGGGQEPQGTAAGNEYCLPALRRLYRPPFYFT